MATHDVTYVWEKLSNSVHHLACADEPLRTRVATAWAHIVSRLDAGDFPTTQRMAFENAREACSSPEAILALDGPTLKQLAERLVNLYGWSARQIPADLAEATLTPAKA